MESLFFLGSIFSMRFFFFHCFLFDEKAASVTFNYKQIIQLNKIRIFSPTFSYVAYLVHFSGFDFFLCIPNFCTIFRFYFLSFRLKCVLFCLCVQYSRSSSMTFFSPVFALRVFWCVQDLNAKCVLVFSSSSSILTIFFGPSLNDLIPYHLLIHFFRRRKAESDRLNSYLFSISSFFCYSIK